MFQLPVEVYIVFELNGCHRVDYRCVRGLPVGRKNRCSRSFVKLLLSKPVL